MRAEFARLVAAGHNPNRVTKLLLPILSGRDASSVVAEAEIALAGLSDGVDAASDGTSGVGGGAAGALPAPAPSSSPVPAAPLMRSGTAPAAASSATRSLLGTPSTLRSSSGGTPSASAAVDADIASGITIERMQGLYDDAASSGDYRPMVSVRSGALAGELSASQLCVVRMVQVRFVGKTFSSAVCVGRSFVGGSVPAFALDGDGSTLAATGAASGEAGGPRGGVMSVFAGTAGVAASSAPASRSAATSAAGVSAPAPLSAAGADADGVGVGVSAALARVRAESSQPTTAAGGAGAKSGGPATPLSPFVALQACDVDAGALMSAYALIQRASEASEAVRNSLYNALPSLVADLHRDAQRDSRSSSNAALLRAFLIVAACPFLEDPATHGTLLAYTRAVDKLSATSRQLLSHWMATIGGSHEFLLRADDPVSIALAGIGVHGHRESPAAVGAAAGGAGSAEAPPGWRQGAPGELRRVMWPCLIPCVTRSLTPAVHAQIPQLCRSCCCSGAWTGRSST